MTDQESAEVARRVTNGEGRGNDPLIRGASDLGEDVPLARIPADRGGDRQSPYSTDRKTSGMQELRSRAEVGRTHGLNGDHPACPQRSVSKLQPVAGLSFPGI